jgi:DNA-binding transcriptional ArsR family regulator
MAATALKGMDKSNLAHAAQAAADFAMMVEKAREASDFLKALSHESRLLLLCALSEGECSVGELENILGERQSTVSQQLARLRLDRLVATRRDGKTIYYSLADENVRAILDALRKAFCEPDEERATKAKKSASTAQAKLKAARR